MQIRRITDDFSVSPQIAVGDLPELRDRGFALVISNRPDGEDPGQPAAGVIAAASAAAGLAFRHIPVAGGFPEAQIAEMADAISAAEGPVLAFCRTGTRSTLLWSLAQASDGGAPEAIAAAARDAGYDIAPVRDVVDLLASRPGG